MRRQRNIGDHTRKPGIVAKRVSNRKVLKHKNIIIELNLFECRNLALQTYRSIHEQEYVDEHGNVEVVLYIKGGI